MEQLQYAENEIRAFMNYAITKYGLEQGIGNKISWRHRSFFSCITLDLRELFWWLALLDYILI